MAKFVSFFFGSMIVSAIFISCKPRYPGLSFSNALDNQGVSTQSECIVQIKEILKKPPFANTSDADMTQNFAKFRDIWDSPDDSLITYQRMLFNKVTTSIESTHSFQRGDRFIEVRSSGWLESGDPLNSDEKKELNLSLDYKLSDANQGMILQFLQTFKIATDMNCAKIISSEIITTFSKKDENNVTAKSKTFRKINGKLLLSGEREVTLPKSLVLSNTGKEKLGLAEFKKHSMPRGKTKSLTEDLEESESTLTEVGKFEEIDPIVNQKVIMTKLNLVSDGKENTVLESTKSEYRRIDAAEGLQIEVINQELMEASSLQSLTYYWRPEFFGFERGDFNHSNLRYLLGSEKDGQYENEQEYFLATDTKESEQALIPKNSPPGIKWRTISFSAANETLEVGKPFMAGSGESAYLKETDNIDFSETNLSKVAKAMKAQLPRNPTYKDVVLGVLDATKSSITFDKDAVKNAEVTIMRASDALKRKKGVCQHFAAIAVALARSIGLPARVVSGFLLEVTSDGKATAGAHAWIEVQIAGKRWLPLEPQQVNLSIPRQAYFPEEVSKEYEATSGAKKQGNSSNFNKRTWIVKLPDLH